MKRILVALLALILMGLVAGTAAPAEAKGPTAGTLLVGGLLNPRGLALGPDGMLYVAEAGEGGNAKVKVDVIPAADLGELETFFNGFTGRISKIDPATGTRTTVVDGLPSNSHPQFGTVGPTDVAFLGGQLYYLQTHGGAVWGFPGWRTGIYKVNADGSLDLVADIGAFNVANPVTDVTPAGGQPDIEPGGNPYSMIARDGAFYVSDGNQNQVMRVTTAGTITRVAELPGHPVSTGVTFNPAGGPFFVAELGKEPFNPEDGRVVTVAALSGDSHVVASGFSGLTDVGFGPGGQLYALQFADQAPPPGPPFAPFTGKVLRVNPGGTMTPVVAGFTFATAMLFDGAKLYVLSNGLSVLGPGEVWAIDDITKVPPVSPPAPAPPAPPAAPVVTAPSTGSGGDLGSSSRVTWLAVGLALAALGLPLAAVGARALRRAGR